MPSLFPDLFTLSQLAPLFLRVALAAVFIPYGYGKIFSDFPGTVRRFEAAGWKRAGLWAQTAGTIEFFGGILLLVGLFTQLAALLVALEMLAGIIKGRTRKSAAGRELEVAFLLAALSLVVLGPGALSIDLPF